MAGTVTEMGKRFFHFTCDHGAEGIDRDEELRPMIPWAMLDEALCRAGFPTPGLAGAPPVVWLTDIECPAGSEIGFDARNRCDRTRHRVVVETDDAMRWDTFATLYGASPAWRRVVESDGRPDRWWVSTKPLPVSVAFLSGDGD